MDRLAKIEEVKDLNFNELKENIFDHIEKIFKNEGSNHYIDTYILWLVYQFYNERNNLIAKDKKYQSKEIAFSIRTDSKDFSDLKITEGMLYFYADFMANRLFNISKTLLDELHELKDDESNNVKRISEIEREISRKVSSAKGFKDLIIRSENKLPSFRGLLKNSMSQFYDSLPSDNLILDREFKKAVQILKGNPSNDKVKKAVEKALDKEGVSFEYVNDSIPKYRVLAINKNFDQYDIDKNENLFDILNHIKMRPPKYDEIKKQLDYENWRPYSSRSLVKILATSYLHQEFEYLSTIELKKIFSQLLLAAKKVDPSFIEVSESTIKNPETSNELSVFDNFVDEDPVFSRISDDNIYRELESTYAILDSIFLDFDEKIEEDIYYKKEFLRNVINIIEKCETLLEDAKDLEKVELFNNIETEKENEIIQAIYKSYPLLPKKFEYIGISLDLIILKKLKDIQQSIKDQT